MWRLYGEGRGKLLQVQPMPSFEPPFSDPVLFGMMGRAQADGPAIRRFKSDSPVSAGANVGAFDGHVETTWHAAMMAAHPRPVAWALALGDGRLSFLFKSIGQAHDLRLHQHEVRHLIVADNRLGAANIGLARLLRRTHWCK
jgi:prepilin-type processing-associated H-X9-DG protein